MRKIITLLGLLLSTTCFAATYPEPTNWVVDVAGKLSQSNIKEMSLISEDLAKSGGPEVAVLIVDSIGGETIESYSIKLAEKWKVGKAGQNNGVILILAVKERKLRIEVGYGLEPVLPDAKAGQIIGHITPYLKAGNWDSGVRVGFNEIVGAIGGAK